MNTQKHISCVTLNYEAVTSLILYTLWKKFKCSLINSVEQTVQCKGILSRFWWCRRQTIKGDWEWNESINYTCVCVLVCVSVKICQNIIVFNSKWTNKCKAEVVLVSKKLSLSAMQWSPSSLDFSPNCPYIIWLVIHLEYIWSPSD